jgi:hypothetical protein
MTFSLFSVKLFFMRNFSISLLDIALTNKNCTLIHTCKINLALSSLLLCFMFVLTMSGCEEKKEIIIREVKQEAPKTGAPAAIAF